jgi:hypothetical protein
MNGIMRAVLAGGAGVFVSDVVEPHLNKILKPDTDLMRKVMRAASAGVGTGVAYWGLGLFSKG